MVLFFQCRGSNSAPWKSHPPRAICAAQGRFRVKARDVHAVCGNAGVFADAEERVKRLQIPAAHLHGVAGIKSAARGEEDQMRGPAEALQAILRGALRMLASAEVGGIVSI